MFERFIRLSEAKGALRRGRYEQALQLASDPLIASHRRAEVIAERALHGLLDRARKRRENGALSGALSDLSRILAAQPEFDGALSLRDDLKRELADENSAAGIAREMLRESRRLAEIGELEAARQLCRSAGEVHALAADENAVKQVIDGRRQLAGELLDRARAAGKKGEWVEARDLLVKARAHARDLSGASSLAREVAVGWGRELLPRLQALREAGDDAGVYSLLSRERSMLPELDGVAELQGLSQDTAAFQTEQLRDLMGRGDLDAAVEIYRDLDPRLRSEPSLKPLGQTMEELSRALDLRDRGDFGGAAECLGRASVELGPECVEAHIVELDAELARSEAALREARELAGSGRLVEARKRLAPVLERWPMHETVRREMEILDQGARDKEQRLGQARSLAKDGKLAEASALALALAIPGPQGEEARLLLVDVQARMDLVQRGLDQTRRAVHGRHSGSAEGLRHCLLRLEQLANVQSDSDDLAELERALAAEVQGVEALENAASALAREQPDEVAEHLAGLIGLVDQLLRPDRLDARVLELIDGLISRAEDASAAGRLTASRGWLSAVSAVSGRYVDIADRCDVLLRDVESRQQRAQEAAARGEEALGSRDLALAEECLQEARMAWIDGAPVLRLESELRKVDGQRIELEQVEQLTSRKDFAEANRRLDDMPPTPGVLRTRIFDIKQGLARAQGLDGGFLLRVDEGGEFVVLRGDCITVGNVREAKADLVVLANIAGQHASILRSMSFHGGMEDRIRADKGEVFIGGKSVPEHVLESGDRVRLGSTLEVTYRVPSTRSLTASLTLSSGFQVAGTDKVLLMRDRGRDGRVLIGPSADAHVRVPDGCPEVEVFARKDGQVRIRCDGKGSMDGRPFSGEHPVTAGALVRCGALSFVLQPLSRPT